MGMFADFLKEKGRFLKKDNVDVHKILKDCAKMENQFKKKLTLVENFLDTWDKGKLNQLRKLMKAMHHIDEIDKKSVAKFESDLDKSIEKIESSELETLVDQTEISKIQKGLGHLKANIAHQLEFFSQSDDKLMIERQHAPQLILLIREEGKILGEERAAIEALKGETSVALSRVLSPEHIQGVCEYAARESVWVEKEKSLCLGSKKVLMTDQVKGRLRVAIERQLHILIYLNKNVSLLLKNKKKIKDKSNIPIILEVIFPLIEAFSNAAGNKEGELLSIVQAQKKALDDKDSTQLTALYAQEGKLNQKLKKILEEILNNPEYQKLLETSIQDNDHNRIESRKASRNWRMQRMGTWTNRAFITLFGGFLISWMSYTQAVRFPKAVDDANEAWKTVRARNKQSRPEEKREIKTLRRIVKRAKVEIKESVKKAKDDQKDNLNTADSLPIAKEHINPPENNEKRQESEEVQKPDPSDISISLRDAKYYATELKKAKYTDNTSSFSIVKLICAENESAPLVLIVKDKHTGTTKRVMKRWEGKPSSPQSKKEMQAELEETVEEDLKELKKIIEIVNPSLAGFEGWAGKNSRGILNAEEQLLKLLLKGTNPHLTPCAMSEIRQVPGKVPFIGLEEERIQILSDLPTALFFRILERIGQAQSNIAASLTQMGTSLKYLNLANEQRRYVLSILHGNPLVDVSGPYTKIVDFLEGEALKRISKIDLKLSEKILRTLKIIENCEKNTGEFKNAKVEGGEYGKLAERQKKNFHTLYNLPKKVPNLNDMRKIIIELRNQVGIEKFLRGLKKVKRKVGLVFFGKDHEPGLVQELKKSGDFHIITIE